MASHVIKCKILAYNYFVGRSGQHKRHQLLVLDFLSFRLKLPASEGRIKFGQYIFHCGQVEGMDPDCCTMSRSFTTSISQSATSGHRRCFTVYFPTVTG